MATEPSPVVETVAPELAYAFQVTIGGASKEVRLRKRVPLRIGRNLPKLIAAVDSGDFYDHVALCQVFVESWDLEGDPTDVASYEELDVLTELTQILRGVGEHVAARMAVDPKS